MSVTHDDVRKIARLAEFEVGEEALPPELPPGTRSTFHGFFVGWNAERSVDEPMPNSSQFVFPAMRAPAALSLLTAVAS